MSSMIWQPRKQEMSFRSITYPFGVGRCHSQHHLSLECTARAAADRSAWPNFRSALRIRSASQTAAHPSVECCTGAIVGETTNHNRIVYRFRGKAASPNRSHHHAEPKSCSTRIS